MANNLIERRRTTTVKNLRTTARSRDTLWRKVRSYNKKISGVGTIGMPEDFDEIALYRCLVCKKEYIA